MAAYIQLEKRWPWIPVSSKNICTVSSNELAFFIGLFGSIHCIGMCGPLAFAIPVIENKWWLIVADKVLYNLGRIVTYTLLGLLMGFIGRQLWIFGLQQFICI